MSNHRPTEEQIRWLAAVLGRELWSELADDTAFQSALNESMAAARRIGLQRLAEKERLQISVGWS